MTKKQAHHFEPFLRNVRHTSRIELSQSSLKKNINFLRRKIGPEARLSCVVKANAYGHGIPQMVTMLCRMGVNHISVASAYEAEEVLEYRSAGTDIMIMGILYDRDIEWAIAHDIEFYVFNYDRLPLVLEKCKKLAKKARVHVEVETGTNRTGMTEPYFKKALTFLKRNKEYITFQGLCTHLAGAESISSNFRTEQQKKRYEGYLSECRKRKFMPIYRHIACSASALVMPETRYDLVRVGVATYGFWPSPDVYYQHLQQAGKLKDTPMSRIISWKTDVMDIKHVPKGDFIGYGTSFQATRNMTVAVVPVGYCNGYPRGQSNRGHVLIKGRKAPITGLINMNLFMADVSDIPGVQPGEEVVLLGKQKNNTINVSSFTNYVQLLNNEMLSRLPAAIPRKIVK
ncbi:alanine racemase [Phaeodactylibacter luteus]|uniref:Alanine racemase n=1 Tax=Phaeodactylibacter luteus TaxID=1564516 RepID=A0A5C6S0I8_9BACT|nr:alanine racemase [Phaeodactylibacter luteus]TXB67914.1 alanine racemase [Phaeodactylibacter luteus]